jgi:predicted ATPase/class 3 adenylate cyclase
LSAEVQPEHEVRKTVTVLFTDVAGSTELGERLDPESVRRVMGLYFDMARRVLERHGGTVEKFIGDAVMAVFGIPTQHEDDALRACRAAMEMQDELDRLNKDLEQDRGVKVATRTGLNTGEVIAGEPSLGHTLVTGDGVNLAARLQQVALPGQVLIGNETYRLVREAVTAEASAPLKVKGKSERISAFRLISVLGPDTMAGRFDTPLVGRRDELRILDESLHRAVHRRACVMATVLGPAGIGKSRLVQEFVGGRRAEATIVRGRCLPYGDGITYWPVVEILTTAAGIGGLDAPDEVRAKIASLLGDDADARQISERLAQLLGLEGATAASEETHWAVRRAFEALATRRPLIAIFDDVHWGEPMFLDLVEHVANWSRDAPILLLCLARLELLEARPGWGGGKLNATSFLLEPLDETECEEVLTNLLDQTELPQEARRRITNGAEGNPLFIEQLIAMMIDEGLLQRDGDRWILVGHPAGPSVPATVMALLDARLDRLPDEERAAIERASIEGKLFHRNGVAELLSTEAERARVSEQLISLVRRDLIRPDRALFAGQEAFRFRHMLIRDAAYKRIPKELRAEMHEKHADWLERVADDRVAEFEEIVAYHLERAYRLRLELRRMDDRARGLAVRAASRLTGGAHRAAERGDARAAVRLLERSAALLPSGHPDWLELLVGLGASLAGVGEYRRAAEALDEAIQLARLSGNQRAEAIALIERGHLRMAIDPEGAGQEAREQAEAAIRLFEEVGDDQGLSRAWRLWSQLDVDLCRWGSFREANERALVHARRAEDDLEEALALRSIAVAMKHDTTPVPEAAARCEEIYRESSNRRLQAYALMDLGFLSGMQGHWTEAREYFARGGEILEEFGLAPSLGVAMKYLGQVELFADDAVAAERALLRGRAILEPIGEKSHLSTVIAILSMAVYEQGRLEEAERLAETAQELGSSDDIGTVVSALGVRAKVEAQRGNFGAGQALVSEAIRLVEQTDMLWLRGLSWMDLAEFEGLASRPAEARKAAQTALALFEQKQASALSRRARVFLSDHVAS